jgi:predicted metalloprotease
MQWQSGRRSDNVEDRRGMPTGGVAVGGVGTILLALVVAFLGGDPTVVLQSGTNPGSYGSYPQVSPANADATADFMATVLADTEDTWKAIFQSKLGAAYREPSLVLYTRATQSACGLGKAAMGPFYCPADQKVYLDLSFFEDLKNRHQAPGDFAQAYVVAHEIGHHVQNLLGISDQVRQMQQRMRPADANDLSVRLELQADCLAGIWAHQAQLARNVLEEGDIEEALNAASQIGDDRLQMQAQGYVTPDSFTHGSAKQRTTWFYRGIETGDLAQCNTFDVAHP